MDVVFGRGVKTGVVRGSYLHRWYREGRRKGTTVEAEKEQALLHTLFRLGSDCS